MYINKISLNLVHWYRANCNGIVFETEGLEIATTSLLDRSELVTNRKKVKRFLLSRGHIVEVDSLIKFWCTVNSLLDGDLRDGRLVPAPRGGTPLYKLYMCVPPPSGGVFAPFWSANEYTLSPFWSGIGYGFRGN